MKDPRPGEGWGGVIRTDRDTQLQRNIWCFCVSSSRLSLRFWSALSVSIPYGFPRKIEGSETSKLLP